MDYRTLLNKRQYEAVTSDAQYLRIIAGAGSGKTRVLTYRIAYLVSERHVDPYHILAFTFTNKAANEMKERATSLVEQILGSTPFLRLFTFHAFSSRFLREEAHCIGYPQSFTIYDDDDQKKLIKSIGVDFGYKKSDEILKKVLRYIDNEKGNKGRYPEDITIVNEMFKDEKLCLKFYEEYERRKEASYALDFNDLILKTTRILEQYPDIRQKWVARYDHILVDEFQDTNDAQCHLISLLCRPDTCVYVVGDPDQTIYTWRGANQKLIMNFDKDFPGAVSIVLDENYRSTKKILSAANQLIAHNTNRVKKDLYTNGDAGEDIEATRQPRAEEEAAWVATKIRQIGRKQVNPEGDNDYRNIAVLYRSSYMTRALERELKDRGVPYRIFGGLRFYERMEVKDLLAYFNLMYNPLDNVAFERIANVPKRSVGETSLDRIRQESASKGVSEYNYIKNFAAYSDSSNLSTRVVNALSQLVTAMEACKARLNERLELYSEILKEFATDIGYYDYLAEMEDLDEDRIANVNELFDDITHFATENPESPFEEYLQNVTLLTSQDDMDSGNYVSLMTIHTAKGLEFDNVFLISMNQGAFPSQRAELESGRDGAEEERRLAYVAITRAKKRLFCSCNTGYSYQTDSNSVPSQYFKEAGIDLPKNYFTDSTPRRNGNPHGSMFGGGWNNPSNPSANKKPVQNPFFSDGDAISPFPQERKPAIEPVAKVTPKTNGITDWAVGDKVHHEKFGDGVLVQKIDAKIIVVKFDEHGKKTLLANHPMLSRGKSEGGDA
ncbi:MAG: UvrD-helicase domain-containing protein [Bacilli bacterium]|nr:UvrD-helicase domain-containing protein [Bacilli bacterium]